jgi:N-acyl homoserine lactone hydrolase
MICTVLVAMAAAPQTSRASPFSAVKVYILDCGRIDVLDMDMFADDGSYAGVHKELVDPCYLIRHPKGDLLWDTGVGDQFAKAGVTYIPGRITARVPITLQSQLQDLGVSPGSISFIAFSHEHIDHIGNANMFGGATWLLNRREHDWIISQEGHDGLPPPLLTQAIAAHKRWIDHDNFDVFEDGSVEIIQAAGHTPGHQVLLVRPSGAQPLLISGDLWHSRANYDHDRVPRINTSRSETIASFAKIRTIAKETGARILIQHAPEDFQPGEVSPAPRP